MKRSTGWNGGLVGRCLISVLCSAGWVSHAAHAQVDRPVILFLGDVLIGTEYGAEAQPVTARWEMAPRLSTFGPGHHHSAVVAIVVDELNECLPPDRRIEILEPNDSSATLKVHFVPRKEFIERLGARGQGIATRNLGIFELSWNARHEIERADVWIAADRLTGNRLRHFVLEEITQSLGLPGDSTRFPDSLFYEVASEGKFGTATRLTPLDRHALRFLYRRVPPGTTPIELGVLIERFWVADD